MEETEVKKHLNEHLGTLDGLMYKEFGLTTGLRIDFVYLEWADEYEIEISGYECKGTVSPASVVKTLREQIAQYQRVVPRMYLVANAREKDKTKTLCSLSGVGLVQVEQSGIVEVCEAPNERQLPLEDAHYKPLRSVAAMFLSFRECFRDLLGKPPRKGIKVPYWCSTPESNDTIQYNCMYDQDFESTCCTVNLENSKKVLKRVDMNQLGEELSKLPEEYWFRAGVTHYYAPRSPLYTPLIQDTASSLTISELSYLQTRSQNQIVWLQVGRAVWNCNELLPRAAHLRRLKNAREALSAVHQTMSGT